MNAQPPGKVCCLFPLPLVIFATAVAASYLSADEGSGVTIQPSASHTSDSVLNDFEVREGYRIELAAAEPLVVDPVSARFDVRGRMWVVEMPDYPSGPEPGASPAGRIRILEDEDGNGRFDRAVTFADGLMFATGVQPYRNGAFVTAAGAILFLADDDGDDRADRREVWFEGFAMENEQLRANHPTLGPDGRVYVAGGLRGGSIQSVDSRFDASRGPVDLRSRDFAFDPEGGSWSAVSGHSQHGLSIDDFGRRIGCSNRNPGIISPLDLSAVRRDPLLAPPDAFTDVAAPGPESRVVPIADAWTTSNLHAGQFSAACGVIAPGLEGPSGEWLLVCEPTGSLVQRQILHRHGSIWQSQREPEPSEFLANGDEWFRPVDLTVGPNGSLYVVDMARAVIEHPHWMPEELKSRADMRDGDDLGRIWRVRLSGDTDPFAAIDSAPLARQALRSPQPEMRALGSQFFLEHGIRGSLEALRGDIADHAAPAAARGRAAQLLARFGQLSRADLEALAVADDARLRGLAARLLVPETSTASMIRRLAADSDSLVRRQAASTLAGGQFPSQTAVEALVSLIAREGNDVWVRRATGSVEEPLVEACAASLLQLGPDQPSAVHDVAKHLTRRLARQDGEAAARLIAEVATRNETSVAETALLLDLLEAWNQGLTDGGLSVSQTLTSLDQATREPLEGLLQKAVARATDPALETSARLQSLRIASQAGRCPEAFRQLLGLRQPAELRLAAIPVLLRHDRQWSLEHFQNRLPSLTHAPRRALASACLADPDTVDWLLSQIEGGNVPKSILDPATASRLRKYRQPEIRRRVAELLAPDADRQQVLQRYRSAATMSGDALAGKRLFAEHCSVCHRIDAVGTNVGPDISDTRKDDPAALLTAILDPNAAIDAAYVRVTLLTGDGRVIDGLLIDETGTDVTLAVQGGDRVTLSREEIEQLQTPGVSLMPEGFESVLNVNQMANLITYLKTWRYLGRDIPIPESVK